jgi:type IV pilus assembly protein PilC
MLFTYTAVDKKGEKKSGSIDAVNKSVAISALQRRDLIVISIKGQEDKSIWQISLFERVPLRDIVIFSRQISTLFNSQVSALKAFTLLASNTENKLLRQKLVQISDDLQSGSSISNALAKHQNIFSLFYINMVRSGEETGKLNEAFAYLADYLDRQYALTSKARNALIYPAFVIIVFITVMILMFVLVIPNLSELLLEAGQEIPVYTKIIISISQFLVDYGVFILLLVIAGVGYLVASARRKKGKAFIDGIKIHMPLVGSLYQKMYLSRIADNLETMLSSSIPIVRSLEITSEVVGNEIYGSILAETAEKVKTGASLSASLSAYEEIPPILVQMIEVGEETGSTGDILKTLAEFYRREVDDAVDTLVGLIEPLMIVFLGLGVGILLTSILVPIYNIASSIA